MKIITTEEHVAIPLLAKALQKYPSPDAVRSAAATSPDLPFCPDMDLYRDVGDKRLADMDAHGITRQILSCPLQSQRLPAAEGVSVVRDANDFLADAVSRHPDRFSALAVLPWSNPEGAAAELERAVTRLGLKGAILAGRASGENAFLDDSRFSPVLEAAQALEVPIYVHPSATMAQVQDLYYGGLGEQLSARLSLYGWGWHHEAGVQILRMILSGAFERFPRLQLIAGHWGEMVPFYLARLDQALPRKATGLSRTITETFAQNVWVTPGGIFDYHQLQFVIQTLGAGRILHAADFPFLGNDGAKTFMEQAPIPEADKTKIAYQNAENLFRL
ncbi:MAG: amidohydrolase family protein [Bacillota bacterium]|nr:amidohydrolase family protein [Bacillota bacterium]